MVSIVPPPDQVIQVQCIARPLLNQERQGKEPVNREWKCLDLPTRRYPFNSLVTKVRHRVCEQVASRSGGLPSNSLHAPRTRSERLAVRSTRAVHRIGQSGFHSLHTYQPTILSGTQALFGFGSNLRQSSRLPGTQDTLCSLFLENQLPSLRQSVPGVCAEFHALSSMESFGRDGACTQIQQVLGVGITRLVPQPTISSTAPARASRL